MKQSAWYISAFALITMISSACTDPTEIGADLLDGDKAEVGFSDTLSVIAFTLPPDTTLTYFPAFNQNEAFRSYPFGEIDDPVFGKSRALLYAQVALTEAAPSFELARLDSVVLVLPLDTLGAYGSRLEPYGLSVHRLTEVIDPNRNYFSNQRFAYDPSPLGSIERVPSFDSVTVIDHGLLTNRARPLRLPAQLRIPLSAQFGEELLRLDPANYSRDSAFVAYFRGLHLRPTTVNQGLLSFDLLSPNAGIFLYYTNSTDTLPLQYQFFFNPFRARVTQFEHDPGSGVVGRYIDNPALGDSLIFVQAMAGPVARIEIPHVQDFKGLIVNKAELEVYIADVPGDDLSLFRPVREMMLLTKDRDGRLVFVDDINLLIRQDQTRAILRRFYGGVPVAGKPGEPMLYRMNFTTHFQGMVEGRKPNELFLSVFDRAQRTTRVPLYGAKHPEYAIRLKVAFTRAQ